MRKIIKKIITIAHPEREQRATAREGNPLSEDAFLSAVRGSKSEVPTRKAELNPDEDAFLDAVKDSRSPRPIDVLVGCIKDTESIRNALADGSL